MPSLIAYVPKKFSPSSIAIIEHAREIVTGYERRGLILTLRQLYYQFVTRNLIPNKQSEYKRLGSIINDARLAGMLDWEMFEDRQRNVRQASLWSGPEGILKAVAQQYLLDKWGTQPCHIEAWIEKDSLVGVIKPICEDLEIPYFSCRGYTSQSEQWSAAQRFIRKWTRLGQKTVILHLGDHDPSGLDMTRDNVERLNLFMRHHKAPPVMIDRLALNMDQVEDYNPPPNPAKSTDARFKNYVEEHGDESWELDALDPTVLANLIREAVDKRLDHGAWDEELKTQRQHQDQLTELAERWDEVRDFLEVE